MKKKILGKSDAWSTNHLSHRPSKSPCSIVDCRIFGEQTDKLKLIWLAVFTTLIPNFTAMYGRRGGVGRDYVFLPKWLDWSNQRKMLIDNLLFQRCYFWSQDQKISPLGLLLVAQLSWQESKRYSRIALHYEPEKYRFDSSSKGSLILPLKQTNKHEPEFF